MVALPPESTPLNQHSLPALEAWLQQLGAVRMDDNPCQWTVSYTHLTLPTIYSV